MLVAISQINKLASKEKSNKFSREYIQEEIGIDSIGSELNITSVSSCTNKPALEQVHEDTKCKQWIQKLKK